MLENKSMLLPGITQGLTSLMSFPQTDELSSPPRPGILTQNTSFMSAEQYLRASGAAATNHANDQTNPPGSPPNMRTLSRSRRSSVAPVVSVSLASRSRSRTPVQKQNTGPPTSPSNRGLEPSSGISTKLGQVKEAAGTAPSTSDHKKVDIEFADFGWDDAFEDDDEDFYANHNQRKPTSKLSSRGNDKEYDGLTGLEVEVQELDLTEDQHPAEGRERDVDDIFPAGYRIGEGIRFEGDIIEEVDPVARSREIGRSLPQSSANSIAALREEGRREAGGKGKVFEVVRKLGSGSYAVVYLVKEVGGTQEFAMKCLSKQDLQEDALHVQLFEATIHLSLPRHPNIVTLYQTLQTSKWLFLLLEMCPGEDL